MGLLRSWVEGANDPAGAFPLNNLPCGVLTSPDTPARCVVAIGGLACDMAALERAGLLWLGDRPVFAEPAWNAFMALGPGAWADLRGRLTECLAEGAAERERVEPHLRPLAGAGMRMPFRVAGYTDFYAGRHHAENVGARAEAPDARHAASVSALSAASSSSRSPNWKSSKRTQTTASR